MAILPKFVIPAPESPLERTMVQTYIDAHAKAVAKVKYDVGVGYSLLEQTEFANPGLYGTSLDRRLPRNRNQILAERVLMIGAAYLIHEGIVISEIDRGGPFIRWNSMDDTTRFRVYAKSNAGDIEGLALFDPAQPISERIDEISNTFASLNNATFKMILVNVESFRLYQTDPMIAEGYASVGSSTYPITIPGEYVLLVDIHSGTCWLYRR